MHNKQFFDILFNRKSVRSFTGEPVRENLNSPIISFR